MATTINELKQLDEQYKKLFGESYIYDFCNATKDYSVQAKELAECIKQKKSCDELFPLIEGAEY